jgi:hypothetical protein
LEVVKSRGQDYEAGEHTMHITDGRLADFPSRSGASPH